MVSALLLTACGDDPNPSSTVGDTTSDGTGTNSGNTATSGNTQSTSTSSSGGMAQSMTAASSAGGGQSTTGAEAESTTRATTGSAGMGTDTSGVGSGGTSAQTSTSTSGAAVPGSSRGCGKTPGVTRASSQDISIDGQQGSYFLSLPAGYDPDTPYALVFGFHGAGSTGQDLRSWFYVEETSENEAVFVYPDGFNGVWESEVYARDFSFVEGLRTAIMENYCIDTNAVFAFGFSYGGWATTQLACSRPDLVHGVASVAGGGPQGQCSGPVPMMLIHGTNDNLEPIASSEATRDDFLDVNQCDGDSTPVDPAPCVSYAGCAEPLQWCPHDGEHNIPFEFDGAIWGFFSSLR